MAKLAADSLMEDPLISQAMEQILETLQKHREKIVSIRPPLEELRVSYEEAVNELGVLRGQELFYPYIGSGIGNGALVELADGSVKYDFISGVGTHWGHSEIRLAAAALEASLQDVPMQTNLQHNRCALELIKILVKHSGMHHCFLTSSGAMANENALKIIFQKKAPAYRVLAFDRNFTGRTITLAQVTDKPHFREGLPANMHVDYVPFYDWKNPKESSENALYVLKQHLKRYPGEHACMCFELIQGEGGNYPGTAEFFLALMRVLKEHQVAIFVDEVQTFSRTDQLFAFQHFGLSEYVDVVSCGKVMQTCATLYKSPFRPKAGLIAQTFISSTSATKISLEIVRSLLYEGYFGPEGKNMQLRKHFVDHLQRLSQKYPEKLAGPYGYGLMIACTPFKGENEKVVQFAKKLFDAGLIAFVAGREPTRLRFLVPAGCVKLQDIDAAAAILDQTLERL